MNRVFLLASCWKKIVFPLAVLFLLAALNSGCQGDMEPAEPPEEPGTPGTPSIPEEIDGGERQEPVIAVYIAEEGDVTEMPMEEYIEGVVAGEMEPDWPLEALAAQAIIARTFTLQKIAEAGGVPDRDAHASTDIEEFQAYSREDITETVRQAVEMTRGQVACHEGSFIRAWFSAYAGPKTALADEGLNFEEGNPPYIHIVESPGETIIPAEEKDWSESFPLESVQAAVSDLTGEDPGSIEDVKIKERGPSGRAVTLAINGQDVPAPDLRLALGSTEMRSTFLEELSLEKDSVNMAGTGYGHGVGVCQWGARAMSEGGSSPGEIVNYFYKNIDLVTLWD